MANPTPAQLSGKQFGRLLVLSPAPALVSASGKTKYPAWLCRCECGREQVIAARLLPYCDSHAAKKDAAYCCDVCKSIRTCKVCLGTFESPTYKAICSDACALRMRRQSSNASYHRKVQADPLYIQRQQDALKDRLESDPVFAQNYRAQRAAQRRQAFARIQADPQRKEQYNAHARQRYAADQLQRIIAQREARKKRWEAMTEQERSAYMDKIRAQNTLLARLRRATPAGSQSVREATRRALAKKQLNMLLGVSAALQQRADSAGVALHSTQAGEP